SGSAFSVIISIRNDCTQCDGIRPAMQALAAKHGNFWTSRRAAKPPKGSCGAFRAGKAMRATLEWRAYFCPLPAIHNPSTPPGRNLGLARKATMVRPSRKTDSGTAMAATLTQDIANRIALD